MHGVFLLGSHLATQIVEKVENILDYGECLNVRYTVYSIIKLLCYGVMVKLCNG